MSFVITQFVNPCFMISLNQIMLVAVLSFWVGYSIAKNRYSRRSHWSISRLLQKEENIQQNIHQTQITLAFEEDNQIPQKQIPICNPEKGQKRQDNSSQNEQQFFLEKIRLEGKKLKERGFFQMYFEKSQTNPLFLRKIEKHETITQYLLNKQNEIIQTKALVPLDRNILLPDENSMLEIGYNQNYQKKISKPDVTKRIVNLSQMPTIFSHMYLENGKFRKLFRNPVQIGKGGFGTVLQALNVVEKKKYALKKIYIKNPHKQQGQQLQLLMNEIQILSHLSHRKIARYHTCWIQEADLSEQNYLARELQVSHLNSERRLSKRNSSEVLSYVSSNSGFEFKKDSVHHSPKKEMNKLQKYTYPEKNSDQNLVYVVYIQMELYQHGNLSAYLKKRKSICQKQVFQIMEQLFEGVSFLHSKGIVHRDLKPQNIFIEENGSIKIGDFGLSILMKDLQKNEKRKVGTPTYMAPQEKQMKQEKKEEDFFLSDIYALGVIYFEMLNMFKTSHEKIQKLNGLKDEIIKGIDGFPMEKKIIKMMTRKRNRPSIETLKISKIFVQLKRIISEEPQISESEGQS